uniref:Reverse transcriptase domain-containing protein n=1 Tax=Tanacetum cinerariifolium TaxID=118510 RepID=A0A6L2M7C0_TANCI|nr:hypothetical protein [Tanacetum cinerariifolium]
MPISEHPPSPAYVPEFVSEPVYLEFMLLEDDVLLAEEQPLHVAVSPTANSPGYIPKSDPKEEDLKEDDEDPEEDPADYPNDKEDEDEEESFTDDANDEEDDKEEDKDKDEEEEHQALTDSVPPPIHRVTARMYVRAQTPISLLSEIEILSPPLPDSPTYPLGYRAMMIRLRAKAPSTSHLLPSSTPPSGTPLLLHIPLPTSSPPLLLPSTSHRADVPEIRRDPEREVGYGIRDTWDEIVKDMLGAPAETDVTGLSQRMTDFVMIVRQNTNEIYRTLDDAQDDRVLESKARLSRKAWVQSMDASDTARVEKMTPKRTRRSTPATTTITTTTLVTNAHLKALIDQGIANALATRDTDRSQNGKESHDSRTGTNLKKKMTDKYCLRGKIKKLEVDLWNQKVKGIDVVSYNQLFHELAFMCARIFPEESNKIKRHISGLANMIYGSVMESKLKTMPDAIEFTTELMDKKISTFAKRQAENKRKFEGTSKTIRTNNKKRTRTLAGSSDKKPYGGSKPLFSK